MEVWYVDEPPHFLHAIDHRHDAKVHYQHTVKLHCFDFGFEIGIHADGGVSIASAVANGFCRRLHIFERHFRHRSQLALDRFAYFDVALVPPRSQVLTALESLTQQPSDRLSLILFYFAVRIAHQLRFRLRPKRAITVTLVAPLLAEFLFARTQHQPSALALSAFTVVEHVL